MFSTYLKNRNLIISSLISFNQFFNLKQDKIQNNLPKIELLVFDSGLFDCIDLDCINGQIL